jgi:adenosylcobinamide-GDP ribazoletransferase
VRPGGLGSPLAQPMDRGARFAVILVAAIFVMLWLGRMGIYLVAVSAVSFLFLRRLMLRRIGGTTGDTAGALVEITEAVLLLTAAVLWDE